MDNVYGNQLRLLYFFLDINKPIPASFLANNIGLSTKTVRKLIRDLNVILVNYEAKLESSSGIGFYLVINNKKKFDDFLAKLEKENTNFEELTIDYLRANFIIRYLLSKNCYVSYSTFEEELFLNITTIKKLKRDATEIIAPFNLKIKSQTSKGIKIVGSEHCIRSLINYEIPLYLKTNLEILHEEQFKKYLIKKDLKDVISKIIIDYQNNYSNNNLSDDSIRYLVDEIYIAYVRNKDKCFLKYDDEIYERFTNRNSYFTAYTISEKLKDFFDESFKEEDIISFAITILAKRPFTKEADFPKNENYTYSMMNAINIVNYLQKINDFKYIYKDNKLINVIAFNLNQILLTAEFCQVKWESKGFMPLMSKKLAVQFANYIDVNFKLKLFKEQIFYLSSLIYPIFGRYPFHFRKRRAIILTTSNKTVELGLKERLLRNYSDILSVIDIFSVYEIDKINIDYYDVCFYTCRKSILDKYNLQIDKIYIDIYFDEYKKEEIKKTIYKVAPDFIGDEKILNNIDIIYLKDVKNKQDCLLKICDIVNPHNQREVIKSIEKDEEYFPNNPRNNVLFISPFVWQTASMTAKIFVLDKPIKCNSQKAQVIIYWDRGKKAEDSNYFENEYFTHVIEKLFSNETIINSIFKNTDGVYLQDFFYQYVYKVLNYGINTRY